MRVFNPAKLDKKRRDRFPSFSEFFRQLVIAAPEYGLKPHINHIHNIINGKVVPGTRYLTLFAHVLECTVDSFLVTKKEKDAKEN